MYTSTRFIMSSYSRPALSPASTTFVYMLTQRYNYSVKRYIPKPYQHIMVENVKKYNVNKATIKRQSSCDNVRSIYKTPRKII